jgi:hypothetical protein
MMMMITYIVFLLQVVRVTYKLVADSLFEKDRLTATVNVILRSFIRTLLMLRNSYFGCFKN